MKTKQIVALSVGVTSTLLCANGQSFQNLNFEQANPVMLPQPAPYYPFEVTAASALPGWTVTLGGIQQTDITENDPSAGSTWVSLVGPGDQTAFPIDGNYSVLLQGGGIPGAAAISQTGLIPAGTQSLLFEAQPPVAPAPAGPLDLLVGTQTVPYLAVGTGANYTLYAANISEWADQSEQLTFSVPSYDGNWEIDDISFSSSAVPEPNTAELVLTAVTILGLQRWRKQGKAMGL